MTVGVPTCSSDTPVLDLARLIVQKNWEAVVVLDEEGHAIGVVGQDELIDCYPDFTDEGPGALEGLTAGEIMSEEIPQVPPDIPLSAAAKIMQDEGVRAVFQMHNAGGITYPAAMLTYAHLLRHLVARSPEELRDLGIEATRTSPLEAFLKRREEARKRNLRESGE
jgi:CBS domain-containing protein